MAGRAWLGNQGTDIVVVVPVIVMLVPVIVAVRAVTVMVIGRLLMSQW
jgi:hypothetical protein